MEHQKVIIEGKALKNLVKENFSLQQKVLLKIGLLSIIPKRDHHVIFNYVFNWIVIYYLHAWLIFLFQQVLISIIILHNYHDDIIIVLLKIP